MFIIHIILIIISILFLFFYREISLHTRLIDYPDEKRKNHKLPIPKSGGIIILFFFLNYFFFILNGNKFLNFSSIYFLIFIFILFFVFYLDDIINLNSYLRLIIIGIIIFFLIKFNPQLEITHLRIETFEKTYLLKNMSIYFTVLCFLLLINAVNLMDGISGLCVIQFLIWIFLLNNIYNLSLLLAMIPLMWFTFLNLQNKIFLGNTGSHLIGFTISIIIILNYNSKTISNIEIIFIYLAIPGIDMLRVFFERIKNKHHPFKADRNHLHHLLINRYSNTKSLIIYFLLTSIPIALTFFLNSKLYFIIILLLILIYLYLIYNLKKKNFGF